MGYKCTFTERCLIWKYRQFTVAYFSYFFYARHIWCVVMCIIDIILKQDKEYLC